MVSFVLENISSLILAIINKIGYLGVFFLMLFQSANIPVPSEITMPFSGFLVQKEVFNFWLIVLAGAFGNLAGSLISYHSASFLIANGLREKYRILKFLISDKSLQMAENFFKKYGAVSVFFGRLMPVISTFISFPAGLAKMKLSTFSILTFSGSFIWSTFLVYLGFIFGENWRTLEIYFRKFDYLILLSLVIAIIWWGWWHFKKKSQIVDKI